MIDEYRKEFREMYESVSRSKRNLLEALEPHFKMFEEKGIGRKRALDNFIIYTKMR